MVTSTSSRNKTVFFFSLCISLLMGRSAVAQDYQKAISNGFDYGFSIEGVDACSNGDLLVVGYSVDTVNANYRFVRLNSFGTVLHSRLFPTGLYYVQVKELSNGSIGWLGVNTATIDGTYQLVFGVMDNAGNIIWSKKVSTVDNMYDYSSVNEDPSGNLIFTYSLAGGTVWIKTNVIGTILFTKKYSDDGSFGKNPAFCTRFLPDGGTITTTKSGSDICLIRLDASGNLVSDFKYTLAGYFHSKTIEVLPNGNYIIGGYKDSYPFVMEITVSGTIIFAKQYSELWVGGYGEIRDIHFLSNGNYLAVGCYGGVACFLTIQQDGSLVSAYSALGSTDNFSTYLVRSSVNQNKLHYYANSSNALVIKSNLEGPYSCYDIPINNLDAQDIVFPTGAESSTVTSETMTGVSNFAITTTSSGNIFSANSCFALSTLEAEDETDLTIFPNPSDGVVNLNYQGKEKLLAISVFDLQMKQVGNFVSGSSGSAQLDLDYLPAGMYLLQLSFSNGEIRTEKLILK